jgi:hypothetical protein
MRRYTMGVTAAAVVAPSAAAVHASAAAGNATNGTGTGAAAGPSLGRVVQVDPIKPTLKVPGSSRL